MIIIGEKINATRKAVAAALEARDEPAIVRIALEQVRAGAHYLDLNGGDPRQDREVENIAWLIDVVQRNTPVPVAIDSANPRAVEKGLSAAKRKPILNSISLEQERFSAMLPLVEKHPCAVVALLMSDAGAPCGTDDRLRNAAELIARLTRAGKALDEIIIDPCFLTISTDAMNGRRVIDAIAGIRKEWPAVHIGGGCSNVSYGLPKRKYVNAALLCQAIYHGMDAGIIDPTVPEIMAVIYAAEAVAGRDDFCMNYVTALR